MPANCAALLTAALIATGSPAAGQRVRSAHVDAGPLDIALVLDLDLETAEIARNLVQGARLACYELEKDDCVALITFTSRPQMRFGFLGKEDNLARRMEHAVSASSSSGSSKVYDALQAAVDLFAKPPDAHRRRAIVIITNHSDKGSRARPGQILTAAQGKSIAIFATSVEPERPQFVPIGVPRGNSPTPDRELKPLAESTGGEFRVRPQSGYLLREVFERIREVVRGEP